MIKTIIDKKNKSKNANNCTIYQSKNGPVLFIYYLILYTTLFITWWLRFLMICKGSSSEKM